MASTALVSLLFRWLHILAAITAVGGAIFARAVVIPAQDVLPDEQRAELQRAMRFRWSRIVAVSIAFLLISGLYNIVMIYRDYVVPRWYHPLFGVKFLLALGVFFIASMLSGRTEAADRFRRNAKFWMNWNIALAVAVVCISGILRAAERKPKEPPPPTSGAASQSQVSWREDVCRSVWLGIS